MKIINWECLEEMKKMEDESVDMILTSPPYDNLRTYNWTLNWNFEIFKSIAKECSRVIKKWWVIVWVVWDATINFCETLSSFKQVIYFNEECKLNVLDTMIYYKQNYAPAYPTMRRYANQFEYMFIFSKWRPDNYNPIQVKKIRNKKEKVWYRQKDWSIIRKIKLKWKETKDASNVWQYAVAWWNKTWHPAVFPEKLAEDHIKTWSNEWDIVLDPFMWSWTVWKMCKLNNRNFIWIEIVKEYYEIAKKRIEWVFNLF